MGVKRVIKRSNQEISLEQAFEEFTVEKEVSVSPATLKNYVQSFEYFVQFSEITNTEEVTEHRLLKWIGAMKKEGIKTASINHYLRDCRAFFYWCMDDRRKYIKPAFKIKLIEGQEEQLKTFSDNELESLLVKPRKQDSFVDWRTWAIVNWVLGTGNRVSTICDVQIGDIDFTNKEIALRHTKNKKAQIIPLSPTLEIALKEYIRIWRRDADGDMWLFPTVGEEQLCSNALRHSFARYCKDRGATKTSMHGLRHTFARGWVKNNGNMFALQKVLGHSNLEMTRKYVQLFSDDIKENYDKFSPLDTIRKTSKRTQLVKRRD